MADIKRDESNVNDSTTTSSNNPQTYASFTFPGSQPPATGPPSIAGLDFSTLPPGARVDIWSIQIPPAAHPIAAVATHPESTRLNARTGSRQAENSFPRNPDHGNPSRGRGRGRGRGRSGHRGRGRADTPALTRDGATPTSSLPAVDPDYGALKLFTDDNDNDRQSQRPRTNATQIGDQDQDHPEYAPMRPPPPPLSHVLAATSPMVPRPSSTQNESRRRTRDEQHAAPAPAHGAQEADDSPQGRWTHNTQAASRSNAVSDTAVLTRRPAGIQHSMSSSLDAAEPAQGRQPKSFPRDEDGHAETIDYSDDEQPSPDQTMLEPEYNDPENRPCPPDLVEDEPLPTEEFTASVLAEMED